MPTSDPTPAVSATPLITLPALLAERAAAATEEPWLFFRRGWDWHWLSWSQVAFQVARASEDLRRSGACGFSPRFDPGSVAAALAIQASGVAATADAEAEIVLPAVPSRLDRWTPDLDLLRTSGSADALVFAGCRLRDLLRTVEAWSSSLSSTPPPAGRKRLRRAIVLASASVEPWVWEALLAWTLVTGAAWALEEDPDAFVSAVLRNRPSLIVAPGSDLGLVALSLREKSHRRWHRLRAVGLVDDAPGEIVCREEWDALGVPVVRLDGIDPED